MKSCLLMLALTGPLSHNCAVAFVTPSITHGISFSRASSSALAVGKEDDGTSMRPETSFGADAVPENQRPVNEFLDVTSQPMFGWAALESGNLGLFSRLATVYSVLFAVM